MSEVPTYPMPKEGWTCFHCGEHFTTLGSAREHFGRTPDRTPGCVIKVELGGERGLLMALRNAEDELARYREEDGVLHRELARVQSLHSVALQAAEEAGYARGLRDWRTDPLEWPLKESQEAVRILGGSDTDGEVTDAAQRVPTMGGSNDE